MLGTAENMTVSEAEVPVCRLTGPVPGSRVCQPCPGAARRSSCAASEQGTPRAPPPFWRERLCAAPCCQQRWPAPAAAGGAGHHGASQAPLHPGLSLPLPGEGRRDAEATAPPLPTRILPADPDPPGSPPRYPPASPARPAHRPSRPGLAAPEVVPARQEVYPAPPLATTRGAALLRAACRRPGGMRGRVAPEGLPRPLGFMLLRAPPPAVGACGCRPRGGSPHGQARVGPSGSKAPRAFTPQG